MSAKKQNSYTVKEVAKLSGVSVRTLRFYDEIGLLKPSYYGGNGYRYYEQEQLLLLQQVLFYRELGFELAQIQKIMSDPKFDKVQALKRHREQLKKEAERTQSLIRTIDKTLALLEEEVPMKDNEMYLGFDPKKQAEYEEWSNKRWGKEITDRYRKGVEDAKELTKDWKKEDFEKVHHDYDKLHREFAEILQRKMTPSSQEAQMLVKRHFALVKRFWTPNRQAYVVLSKTYCEHPDYRKLYDGYHPKLAEFLAEAMQIYAERELKE